MLLPLSTECFAPSCHCQSSDPTWLGLRFLASLEVTILVGEGRQRAGVWKVPLAPGSSFPFPFFLVAHFFTAVFLDLSTFTHSEHSGFHLLTLFLWEFLRSYGLIMWYHHRPCHRHDTCVHQAARSACLSLLAMADSEMIKILRKCALSVATHPPTAFQIVLHRWPLPPEDDMAFLTRVGPPLQLPMQWCPLALCFASVAAALALSAPSGFLAGRCFLINLSLAQTGAPSPALLAPASCWQVHWAHLHTRQPHPQGCKPLKVDSA